MNSTPLVSDLVHVVIKTLKPYEHTGLQLAPRAVETLVRNLRTIEELALDVEQELGIQMELRRMVAGRQDLRDQRFVDRVNSIAGDNIVRLPTRVRIVVSPPDGGDAA